MRPVVVVALILVVAPVVIAAAPQVRPTPAPVMPPPLPPVMRAPAKAPPGDSEPPRCTPRPAVKTVATSGKPAAGTVKRGNAKSVCPTCPPPCD